MSELIFLRMLPYAVLGCLLGAIYFSALGWNVRLYAGGGAGWKALALHLLRIVAIAAAFAICARQGAVQLLSSFAGFLVMRTVAINRSRLGVGNDS